MALRDETRKEPVLADIESLERLLKETLDPRSASKNAAHLSNASSQSSWINPNTIEANSTLNHAQPTKMGQNINTLDVPPLNLPGFDFFNAPAAQNSQSEPPDDKEPQNEQLAHQINFEAAMAQLSRIIEPPHPHLYQGETESVKAKPEADPISLFFEEEYGYKTSNSAMREEALKGEALKGEAFLPPQPAQMQEDAYVREDELPFASPPPYSVPEMAGERVFGVDASQAMPHPLTATRNDAPSHGHPAQMRADAGVPPYTEPLDNGISALDSVETMLAQEAAKAAIGSRANVKRSSRVFFALAGVATIGIASLIGMSVINGRSKTVETARGDVPVIAAKSSPAKEKPDNPGGLVIPDQNKQVLSTRTQLDTKPAQVLNTNEQPIDLTQITKKEPARVVLPNPVQPAQQETANTSTPLEPRRVSSVRLGASGVETAPTPTPTPTPNSSSSLPPSSLPPSSLPQQANAGLAPRAVLPPPMPTNTPASSSAPPASPPVQAKVETRPNLPLPPVSRPIPAAPTPPAASNNASITPSRPAANAPLALTQQANVRGAATASAGTYAVQLASRPSEANAREALSQVRTRYSTQLGGKPLSVVNGEANGQVVYRVRAIGYSQADAEAACNQIKAAGGGCFVTKQ